MNHSRYIGLRCCMSIFLKVKLGKLRTVFCILGENWKSLRTKVFFFSLDGSNFSSQMVIWRFGPILEHVHDAIQPILEYCLEFPQLCTKLASHFNQAQFLTRKEMHKQKAYYCSREWILIPRGNVHSLFICHSNSHEKF